MPWDPWDPVSPCRPCGPCGPSTPWGPWIEPPSTQLLLAAHRLAHHQHLAAAISIHRIDQLIEPIEIERGPGRSSASAVVDRHGVAGLQALAQPVKRMERTFISIWLARASGPIRSTIERSTSTSPPNRCTASARWSTTP